jgi:hypothetical protein
MHLLTPYMFTNPNSIQNTSIHPMKIGVRRIISTAEHLKNIFACLKIQKTIFNQ